MKKLTLMMTALPLVAGTTLAVAQPPAATGSSAVSSYSPPIEHRPRKPKKPKKGASAPVVAPSAASQP
jgi:hypothetical protein